MDYDTLRIMIGAGFFAAMPTILDLIEKLIPRVKHWVSSRYASIRRRFSK
jgi:thiamine transporter ThiT